MKNSGSALCKTTTRTFSSASSSLAEFVKFLRQNLIKKIYRRVIDTDECDSRIKPEPETFVIRISHGRGSISVTVPDGRSVPE
jgi:hypothetical protein